MQQADSLTVAVVFDYDGLGRLSAITGPLGDAYTYSYDLDDRVEERTFPAGEVQWGYDADHRLTSHEIVIDAATELENTMVYDAGNRVETLGGDGDGTMAYSGMGAVVWSSNLAWAGPLTVEEFLMDPFGAQIRRVSISGEAEADSVAFRNNINQYGRITYTEEEWARDYPTSAPNGWEPGYNDYAYDVSGNRSTSYQERNVWHVPESGDAEKLVEYREETRSFYAADDKLAAFQINRDSIRYDTIWGGSYEEGNWGAYEEYWYDGLGRRILKRSRQDTPHCAIAARCYSSIERIVWDGEQILWELRQAGAGDTKNPSAGDYTGTVGYVHGADVDAPLALMRFGTQVLHQTWRGLYAFATDTDGDFTTCTPEPFAYCESVAWPGGNGSTFLINKVQETQYWLGSLIMDQRDATGLSYRRNRYYDPESGQFTQQDPIGIAGGLNLYGYANGDPVNFSDPFGLSPCDELWDPAVGDDEFFDMAEKYWECREEQHNYESAADDWTAAHERQCRGAIINATGSSALEFSGWGALRKGYYAARYGWRLWNQGLKHLGRFQMQHGAATVVAVGAGDVAQGAVGAVVEEELLGGEAGWADVIPFGPATLDDLNDARLACK